MTYANPPAYLDQLKLQLGNSASWVAAGGIDANIHYPNATNPQFPCAILSEDNVVYTKLLYGMAPVPSGTLEIFISTDTSVGDVEKLARAIADEICIDLGLAALSVEAITPSNTPSAAEIAEGSTIIYECAISLSFGLSL